MLYSVYFAALLSAILLTGECFKSTRDSTVTPSITRKIKNIVKTTSKAAKSAWKASSETVTGLFTDDKDSNYNADETLSGPLGPKEPVGSTERQEEDFSPLEDNLPSDEDLQGSDFDLATIDEESESVLSQIMDIASTGVSTVYQTAKKNIYDRGAKLIHNFSERVRYIVHEELYLFLQTVTNGLGESLLTPG